MSANAISNARLAVANLVQGVNFLKRSRSGKVELTAPGGVAGLIRGLFQRRASDRVQPETSLRDALARNKAARERFERVLAQTIVPEEATRRAAWLRQTRLAMRELVDLLAELEGPTVANPPLIQQPSSRPQPKGGGHE